MTLKSGHIAQIPLFMVVLITLIGTFSGGIHPMIGGFLLLFEAVTLIFVIQETENNHG